MRKLSNVVFMVVVMLSILCTFAVVQAADSSGVKINPLNIQGDSIYLPETGSFAIGAGTNIATIRDVVELRGMVVTTVDKTERNLIGIGLGVNLPKVIAKLGGTWLLDNVNSSIGITALTNFDGKAHIEPAIYLTVVSISY